MCKLLCDSNIRLENFNDVLRLYGDDFDHQRLKTQLTVLHSNLDSDVKALSGGMKLKSIISYLQSLCLAERELYSEVIKVAKLILVMPATKAVSERSFSTLRRLKTWLRSTMNQDRLNWCMMLHIHNNDTDALDLNYLANEFVSQNSSRHSIFGKFV